MAIKSDIEIAQEAKMEPVGQVAARLGIPEDDLEFYGKYKAKISEDFLNSDALQQRQDGKLILVTAINPTPAGEGKTTVSIGLADALHQLGKSVCLALREPSLGPCFGVKGGAAGGGYAQLVPMEDLNLHFTGDFHAITSANNLLAAAIDNHIHFGNALRIDPTRIVWKRCMDMNDRALRNITVGLGGHVNGPVREDHFVITAASEIMAIFCLASDLEDLRRRLDRIVVAYTYDNEPVTADKLHVTGAMMALLKTAMQPNLMQTIEHTPALVHGGPFANIAHGCNSIRATRTALKLADYVVTEAGFGADLGAEKFMDIKCRTAGIAPQAAVLVATVQALKYNGGVPKADLKKENVKALQDGICNLGKHVENLHKFGVPIVVAINSFVTDTPAEIQVIEDFCKAHGCEFSLTSVWAEGGKGGLDLAEKVLSLVDGTDGTGAAPSASTGATGKAVSSAIAGETQGTQPAGCGSYPLDRTQPAGNDSHPLDGTHPAGDGSYPLDRTHPAGGDFHPLYDLDQPLTAKIETIAREIYGADGVEYTAAAAKSLQKLETLGFGKLPVCIAKTQYSLSDDQHKLGRPTNFHITVRDAYVSAGAGFVVVLTGEIIQMPGLPRVPAAENIDVDASGQITGLF